MPLEKLVAYGYHGTTPEAAERILAATDPRRRFLPSSNREDWLGDGVYFFQDAPERARLWPTLRMPVHTRSNEAIVIGAKINLAQCLDMLDIGARHEFKNAYPVFIRETLAQHEQILQNRGPARRFDRELVNFVVERAFLNGLDITSVRSAFEEGEPLVPGSALKEYSHVQIVVRPHRQTAIESVWLHEAKGDE